MQLGSNSPADWMANQCYPAKPVHFPPPFIPPQKQGREQLEAGIAFTGLLSQITTRPLREEDSRSHQLQMNDTVMQTEELIRLKHGGEENTLFLSCMICLICFPAWLWLCEQLLCEQRGAAVEKGHVGCCRSCLFSHVLVLEPAR